MLTKENTKQQKGIAIVLMLIHHLYIMNDRIPIGYEYTSGITISNMDLINIVASFGKICVSLFMFLGGYGIFKSVSSQGKEVSITKGSFSKRIISLYRSYWKVFLVFIPIAFTFFDSCVVTCTNPAYHDWFSVFSFKDFVSNFFAWSCSYNGEWWFFKTYIVTLFLGYIFIQLFKRSKNVYIEFSAIIIYQIIITNIATIANTTPMLQSLLSNVFFTNIFAINEYSVLFFVGVVFAKYDILTEWTELTKKYNIFEKILLSLSLIIFTVYLRVFIVPVALDTVLVPIFVFATMTFVNTTKIFQKPLGILGNHSTNIWLIHSFYCYYFYPIPKYIYGLKQPVLTFTALLILSFVSSLLLNKLWNLVGWIYSKSSSGFIHITQSLLFK